MFLFIIFLYVTLVHTSFYFIALAQIEDSIARRKNQNTTTMGEPMQPKGKSINNAYMRSNLSSDHLVTLSHNKTFEPPS
jgi:hypothetical protein